MDPDASTLADVLTLADGLFRGWEAAVRQPLVGTSRRNKTTQQAAIAFALASQAHHSATAALQLLQQGRSLVAMPLVRMTYECAIDAHWVSQEPDAAKAFMNEDMRQRRNLAQQLRKASGLGHLAAPIEAQLLDELETNSNARHFSTICADLSPGGDDAYAAYRMMSQYSHPSILIADAYVLEGDDAFTVSHRPHDQPDAKSWAFIIA